MTNPGDQYFERKPGFSPEARGLVAEMETLTGADQRFNHADIPTEVALHLIKQGEIESLAHFELLLRQMDSRVHFVAVPLDFYGSEWLGKTRGIGQNSQVEHTLWVGVNGEAETAQMMERLGVTPDQNLANLTTTGVLVA